MKPTPAERATGRFMRAPDGHDGGDAPGASEGDGDAKAGDAPKSDQSDGSGDGDDGASVLGEADAGDGAGDEGGDKPKDGESGDADEGADDKGKDGDVPEAYDLKLIVAGKDDDGKDIETEVEMDKVLVEEASPILKDLKLNNDQANKLVALVPKVQERMLQQQADDYKAMTAQWARDAEKDPEIGLGKWKESQALAAKALDHYGAPKGSEFRKLLDDSGLGNHPQMIRMFRAVGAAISEDTKLERDTTNPQGKKDKLAVSYPDDVPKK